MRFTAAFSLLLANEVAHGFTVSPNTALSFLRSSSTRSTPLFGILDEINSDDYNLMSATEETDVKSNDVYEMFLADLVFSTNDPRVDIMNSYEQASDQKFITWLDNKIQNSRDPEERLALKDLYDIIVDVKKRVELSKLAEEREAAEKEAKEKERIAQFDAQAEAGRKMSNADVLRKASAIDTANLDDGSKTTKEKKNFYDQELTPEIRMSYEDLLKQCLPPYSGGESMKSIVYNNYNKFDAQFVKVLNERAFNGDTDSAQLLEVLAVEQQTRIAASTETLRGVLALGDPMRMEGAIVKLAREGKIDEAFLLLLEANETQARDAGANGPAELMRKLRLRAADEKDKQVSSKEVRLIRKLLRAADAPEREEILVDAFTPRESLLVPGTSENAMKAVDGEQPEQEKPMPDVPPPSFIDACKAVLLNFGNLAYDDDRGDLASRIKQIAAEAEVVATRIYGKGMTTREQQDRAWKEQTTSIFDLETMEIEAERMGESAPWTNPNAGDDIILPGFGPDGKMKIGGS